MNKNTRWALALVGVAIIIAAVVFISTGKDDTDATQSTTPTESTSRPSTESTGPTGSTSTGGATGGGGNSGGATSGSGGSTDDSNDTGGAKPDDNGTGGAKVSSEQGPLLVAGKVAKITVNQGDTVYVRAKSATHDELHIHGYDYKVDLPAGKTVSYKFKADIGGSFEMEFEDAGLQVAALKVNP